MVKRKIGSAKYLLSISICDLHLPNLVLFLKVSDQDDSSLPAAFLPFASSS